MVIDASIYSALGGQRKSAMDYADEYARRDIERQAGRQQVELGALALRGKRAEFEDYQRDRGEQAAVTSALAGLAPDAAPERRIAAVRALGTRTALKAADDLERAQIERAQAQAQIDDRKQSAVGQRIKVYREALGSGLVSDPQSAAQWLRAQYEDPVTGEYMTRLAGPYEQAVERIPTDPAGFARWQQQSVIGMDRFLSSTAPRPQQIRAGDRVVIVDMNPSSPTYGQEQGAVGVNATPGQQMVHERALARAQGRKDLAANKPPAGYRWTAGGALEPIPGGPADKGGAAGAAPKLGAEVNRQITGILSLNRDLEALKSELRGFNPRSLDQFNPVKRARIESLSKQALMNAKEAAALGALTGPDMAIIEGILSTPTSARGVLIGGAGSLAQIDQVLAGNRRRFDALREQYGDAAVPEAYRGPAAATAGASPPRGQAPQQQAPRPAQQAAPVMTRTKAEYDALQPGTVYTAPDGKTRVKQ